MKIRVAVIGGGAAGLCALRHLASRPDKFEAQGYEQLEGVGGTWRYTDKVGIYNNGRPVQSSMYKNLKTNLPKEVMAFQDFPFPSHLPSFVTHENVLEYLETYYQHYQLQDYLQLNTSVDHVSLVSSGDKPVWQVTTTYKGRSSTRQFDAVMVCNGHYEVPLFPTLEGAEEFKGEITHSHNYRVPDVYSDKVVVCLGAAASGQDVSLDIATCAKKVIISHNKAPLKTVLPENVCQKPGIDRLTADSVIFKDGSEEKADVIMLCTGYRYNFPFMADECRVCIEDERVMPLYKHIVHTKHPLLFFIGICKTICPFPQFNNQVRFVLSILDGSLTLPSEAEMNEDIQRDFEKRLAEGLPARYAHTMGPRQWAYNDELAKMGNFEPIPKAVQILYDAVHEMRVKDLPGYKKKQYKITGDESYEEIVSET